MLLARRTWRTARRLSARGKGREHLAELGQLAGGLAHEIKNPLSTIKLNLRLLAEDLGGNHDDASDRNVRRLERLGNEVQRVEDILDDFLKYAGKQELHLVATDLRQVLEELIDFFRPQAEAARVVLRGSWPSETVAARADVPLLKQAVLNLMINSLQAMTEGGELLLRLGGDQQRATIEVIDTGPGIPQDLREKVFDPYFSGRQGGSGLGLPTTRRIVRQHDGEVSIDGDPGQGTRFLITLPRVAAPED
jgi:signal transduction histidine kinase